MRYLVYFIMTAGFTYIMIYNIAKPIDKRNRLTFILTCSLFWFIFGFIFLKCYLTGTL